MDDAPVHAWQSMYPPLASHARDWLDVGDGHAMHWEESGHPLGTPALFVHGGPGAGCTADDRRWFDPARYRIVLFDQRGAGFSRPHGRLEANSTAHLLRDMEALRRHLHIDRWLLFGGSWGATLALAYAQAHPQRVSALVLRGVFTATARESIGLYGAHRSAWLAGLEQRLHSQDESIGHAAALEWAAWEEDLMSERGDDSREREEAEVRVAEQSPGPLADPHPHPLPQAGEGATANPALLAMARIGVHYARRNWFLDEAQLLRDAGRLRGITGVIVQGKHDRVTPPAAALALHQAWPDSVLVSIDAGHSSSSPEMARRLIAATDAMSLWFRCRAALEPAFAASPEAHCSAASANPGRCA